ncbi:centromere protein L [Hemicordylus capensis]|uniref:centromere protein L n=1 Tax=Hemicordylus capensis TaxID=884348 RepID=UPI00230268B0|nr:centromere protein L [Hemicordylus capensis]
MSSPQLSSTEQVQQQDTGSPDSRKVPTSGGKTADHVVNFSNTAHVSKSRVSLRRGNLFGQSPAKRKIPQTPHLQENVDPQINLLIRKQWILYSVTPLYKFSYNQLQEYSRQLSFFIAAEKQKRPAVEAELDLGFTVKFSSISTLKATGLDQPAVLIQIAQRSRNAAEKAGGKVLWTGCFCCTCADDMLEAVMEDFTCLPLFLVKGSESLLTIVGTWFQQTFDCCFSRLTISSMNLAWMAAMWTASKADSHTVATELTFSVPCSPYPLDISYAIHPDDAKAFWDSIHTTQGEVHQEEVDLFMEMLYCHFHRHFKIYLSATRLVKVSTSVAAAHSDGKIKILHTRYLIGVLSLLTELAISKIM